MFPGLWLIVVKAADGRSSDSEGGQVFGLTHRGREVAQVGAKSQGRAAHAVLSTMCCTSKLILCIF